jgi:hypothetical protein
MSHARIALHRAAAGFWGGRQDARVIGSLAALIAAALVMVAAAVYLGSLRQDRLQVASEQRIVALAVENLKEAIATNARDYAWWNEAVEHLTLELDEAWAEINIGPYLDSYEPIDPAVSRSKAPIRDGRGRAGQQSELAGSLGPLVSGGTARS